MTSATIDKPAHAGLAAARRRWGGIGIMSRLGQGWFRGWVQYVTLFLRGADRRAGPLPWK